MKKFISMLMSCMMTFGLCGMVMATSGISIGSSSALNGILSAVLGVVKAIATAFAIGMLLYVGIKYTMASANEKADLKKGSINYVIGAVIIFACTGIISVLQSLGDEIVTES